jgi:hypothetical protein
MSQGILRGGLGRNQPEQNSRLKESFHTGMMKIDESLRTQTISSSLISLLAASRLLSRFVVKCQMSIVTAVSPKDNPTRTQMYLDTTDSPSPGLKLNKEVEKIDWGLRIC